MNKNHRWTMFFLFFALISIFSIISLFTAGLAIMNNDRIAYGVRIGELPLSGLTEAAAREKIAGYCQQKLSGPGLLLRHAGLEYTHKKWNWLLDAQYVSQRQTPDAVTGEYGSEDAFFLMNTSLNYKIEKDMTLQLGVQNLFDKHFFAAEAAAGRTYSLRMDYHF